MKQESIHIQLSRILIANKDGSFSTQAARHDNLMAAMSDLHRLGYSNLKITNLRTTHIKALATDWIGKSLSSGTIKNRVSHLRWLAKKLNKQNIVPRTNKELGIANRCYANNIENRAKELTPKDLEKIGNEWVRLSLQLQCAFGLREAESMKFQPSYADKGDCLVLKGSWCKGGRERTIPIRTTEQRTLLDHCHRLAGEGSLIPPDKMYKTHKSSFEKYCQRAELRNIHGYRHQYAQQLYREITGWECPKNGGISKKAMTENQREIDKKARLQVSRELGHNRENITTNYLGY